MGARVAPIGCINTPSKKNVAARKLDTPSMKQLGPTDPVLPLAVMELFCRAFAGDDVSVCGAIDFVALPLNGLPETCVIVGDADPLLSDSQLLVENLRDSGVAVEEHVFAGMPHGFSMVRPLNPYAPASFSASGKVSSWTAERRLL